MASEEAFLMAIKDDPDEDAHRLPRLRFLDLRGANVSREGLKRLKRARPDVLVAQRW